MYESFVVRFFKIKECGGRNTDMETDKLAHVWVICCKIFAK